ncbi:MAG: hypothetical protein CO093_07325 [Alphaproteobacteria bacterium CG_4_9_14_3_um_filter_47_13]|nr:MAG: hypothetical protein CO093_07325 [Alphaproteobacteria bacterium CG_4_9_14_3_um_filter_47_13]
MPDPAGRNPKKDSGHSFCHSQKAKPRAIARIANFGYAIFSHLHPPEYGIIYSHEIRETAQNPVWQANNFLHKSNKYPAQFLHRQKQAILSIEYQQLMLASSSRRNDDVEQIVIARSVSDEATQRPQERFWIATPPLAARNDNGWGESLAMTKKLCVLCAMRPSFIRPLNNVFKIVFPNKCLI